MLFSLSVPKMYEALKGGGPVSFDRKPTIATGLAPPTAGMYHTTIPSLSKMLFIVEMVLYQSVLHKNMN